MTAVEHGLFKELQFFRKEGAGEINENWVQWLSLPREYAEAYRYNNSTCSPIQIPTPQESDNLER